MAKIIDGGRSLPNRIVPSSIQARRLLGPGCSRQPCAGAWSLALCACRCACGSHEDREGGQALEESRAPDHSAVRRTASIVVTHDLVINHTSRAYSWRDRV